MSIVDGPTPGWWASQSLGRKAVVAAGLPLGAGIAGAAAVAMAMPDGATFGLGLVALAAAVALWLIDRVVLGPVRAAADELTRLAAGGEPRPRLDGRVDEIGAIGTAALALRRQRLEAREAASDAEQGRASAVAERSTDEAQNRTGQAENAEAVRALGAALDRLAQGDLTHRIRTAFPEAYLKLRDDLNGAYEALETALSQISDNAEAVRQAATEIAIASDDLSRRTESQAASLEETAAAIEEITSTTRSTADNASRARQVVARAKAEAESGGDVVRQAIGAMSNIETSSEKIGQIIGLIDEISFQTNLLALNAGVEAARAGEAGKGFAVVASEVRALAQRSADAAKEIKGLILSSKREVEKGVELVGGTGEALERIIARVAEINEAVGEIATSAAEQATGLQEVNGAVSQMDQITQQNAAMVEKATIAVRALSQQTDQFANLVGKFTLSRTGRGAPPAASRTAASSPVRGSDAPRAAGTSGSAPIRMPAMPASAAPVKPITLHPKTTATHSKPGASHAKAAPAHTRPTAATLAKAAPPAKGLHPKPAGAPAKPLHAKPAVPPAKPAHAAPTATKSATVTTFKAKPKAAPPAVSMPHAPKPETKAPPPPPRPAPTTDSAPPRRRAAAAARADSGGWEEF